MQEGNNAKQQIVEKLKNSTNILVTVSSNPSVDELSAALGLTIMLNKLDKHGTAVFSGNVPPAITFLHPEKTFEGTTDSLRDFIVALDKEKADRLRYKVDGDMVRIYITPYRTTITQKDLQFSQGDFNVEAIIALGVEKKEDLDKAISKHSKILHDASVMTVNTKPDANQLGEVDWKDTEASSLCEMLVALSESLQPGLLDEQSSTALLTGIVAATDRFSNELTKPRVMTMAAQLMAAGANQQLIANKLESTNVINPPTAGKTKSDAKNSDGSTNLKENASSKVRQEEKKEEKKSEDKSKDSKDDKKSNKSDDDKSDKSGGGQGGEDKSDEKKDEKQEDKSPGGEMQVGHGKAEEAEAGPPKSRVEAETAGMTPEQIEARRQDQAVHAAEGALANASGGSSGLSGTDSSLADLQRELEKEAQQTVDSSTSQAQQPEQPAPPPPQPQVQASEQGTSNQPEQQSNQDENQERKAFTDEKPSWDGHHIEPPTMGGTLNATSEQALKDAKQREEDERNRTTLHHGDYPVNQQPPNNKGKDVSPSAPGQLPQVSPPPAPSSPAPAPNMPPPPAPTGQPQASSSNNSSPGPAPVGNVNAARDAVHAAIDNGPANTGAATAGMPDYEAMPPPPPAPTNQPPQPQASSGAPAPPPMPDMSNLPPMPPPPPPPSGGENSPNQNLNQAPSGPQASSNLPPIGQATGANTSPGGAAANPSQADPFGPPPLEFDHNDNSGQPQASNRPAANDPGQFKLPGQ